MKLEKFSCSTEILKPHISIPRHIFSSMLRTVFCDLIPYYTRWIQDNILVHSTHWICTVQFSAFTFAQNQNKNDNDDDLQ